MVIEIVEGDGWIGAQCPVCQGQPIMLWPRASADAMAASLRELTAHARRCRVGELGAATLNQRLFERYLGTRGDQS